MRRSALLYLAVLVLQGCAHYVVNEQKSATSPGLEYRFPAVAQGPNTNSLFVCLEFSGGGTRAAALSYGVLEKLRKTRIVWKGREKTFLDEVDCISSVSGGSFTAAYYGLFGERTFADFRHRFLDVDIQGALLRKLFNPINLVRLASPYFSRIDLAAEYYDEEIFERKTFAALAQHSRRPFIMLNATNMANGERFDFTQDQFDFLGSDLSRYPIARAVAASSAFPYLLSPITLQNFPHEPFSPPKDYLEGLGDRERNRRRYIWARNRMMYLDEARLPYVHLMDGGLADNIGLRPIEGAWRRTSGFIRKLMNDGEIDTFVLIVVNARAAGEDTLSKKESPPGLFDVAYKTATIAMDNYSVETIEVMKDLRDERVKAQKTIAACQKKLDQCPGSPQLPRFAADIDPYIVEVDFEAIADPQRQAYFMNLPTSFSLDKDQVQALIDIGGQLLDDSAEFCKVREALASR
jgi:NTE family protein